MGECKTVNKIEFEINNNRTMQLAQQSYDGSITLSTFNKTTSETDHEEVITAGDMVMLINYYRHVKSNNIQCDFVNP
ncbi:hypothetical protein D3C74_394540 [compost metagenome]